MSQRFTDHELADYQRGGYYVVRSLFDGDEIDKLLTLDMVPPTVERQLDGNTGAAQVWVENIIGLKDGAPPEEAVRGKWETQLTRAAMFDALGLTVNLCGAVTMVGS